MLPQIRRGRSKDSRQLADIQQEDSLPKASPAFTKSATEAEQKQAQKPTKNLSFLC
jgi:hypothetical protein